MFSLIEQKYGNLRSVPDFLIWIEFEHKKVVFADYKSNLLIFF